MKKITTSAWRSARPSPSPARLRPQIKMGVTGPLTGPNAAFGAQLKNGAEQAVEDINAAGGILGQKITLELRRRRVRSQAGRLGRQQVRRRRRQVRGRPLQLRRHDAGLRSLCGERHPRRSRRPRPTRRSPSAACGTPSAPAAATISRARSPATTSLDEVQGQEDRHRPRQDDLRPGPRRRDQEGDERKGGMKEVALRRRQRRREGLFGARLQDQGIRRRPRLLGRPAHRRRPDRAPDARPGHQGSADGRRRHHRRTSSPRSAAPASKAR